MRARVLTVGWVLVLALAGCVGTGPGRGTSGLDAGDRGASAIAGAPIEVTPLDAPAARTASPPRAPAAAPATARPASGPPPASLAAEKPRTAPDDVARPHPDSPSSAPPKAVEDADAAAAPPEGADPAADPVADPPASPAQARCEARGNIWARAGDGDAFACVRRTRDGGERCSRKTQCEGECLARSGTCAPVAPLFGCNDILQADGRRVTLCLD